MKVLLAKQFAVFLSRLTSLVDVKFFIVRYCVFFIGFLEIILLPVLLKSGFFAEVEFIKQIFLLVPFLLLGMHSGYLYVYYADKREFHVPLLVTGCLVGFLSFVLLLLYTNNVLVSCAVLSLIMAIVIEKILVSYGSLILASLYKALVSGVLIIGAVFVYVFDLNISSYSFYSLSFVFGFFAWLLLVFLYSNFFATLHRPMLSSLKTDCLRMIKSGFFISLHTFFLIGYLLFDRFVVNTYYSNYSAEYALAFSLSQIVFIGVNAVAYVSQHRIGVGFESMTRFDYMHLVESVWRLFFILFVFGLSVCFVVSHFVSNYGQFVYSYIVISFLFGGYYVYSSISSVGMYRGLASHSLIVFVIVFVINIFVTLMFVYLDVPYYINVVKTGALLLASALCYHLIILRRVYS